MTEVEHNEFYSSTKEQQFEIIIGLISRLGEVNTINEFKMYYEKAHSASFDFDKIRYDYSFLMSMTVYQAVTLYDNLAIDSRSNYIKVIEHDHAHLLDVVTLHNMVNEYNTVDRPPVFS